jgi:HEAT repeat protein
VLIVQAFRNIGPGAKGAVPDLIQRLHNDPDWSVRQYSAEALGDIGPVAIKAAPDLQKALGDKMVQVRNAATWALGKMKAKQTLIECVKDKDTEVRANVIIALSNLKDPEVIPTFAERLLKDDEPRVRLVAVVGLELLGKEAAPAVPQLQEALADKSDEVRQQAAQALRTIGPPARAAVPTLLKVARSDPAPKAREAAAWALYAIGMKNQKSALPTLIDMLKDTDTAVPSFALYCLEQMGVDAQAALPEVRKLVNHPRFGPVAQQTLRKLEGK